LHNIEVVKMTEENIDEVLVVENLSFRIPWSKNAFLEEVTNNKFARYIAVAYDGRIVGYAGMWKVIDEGHITNIAVHPGFRGNGIGSLLMEKLIGLAKDEEVTSMTLEVRRSNLIAQKLYTKYGFLPGGVRKSYYSDNGEDAIIMWKNGIEQD
jgi:[ribosomal protein S18]-alanine N-acetyltransferase